MYSLISYLFEQYAKIIMRYIKGVTKFSTIVMLSATVPNTVFADPFKICDIKDQYLEPPIDIIECLHDNGHPYSTIEFELESSNKKIFHVNPGPKVNISKITFKDYDYSWHSEELIDIEVGDQYSKSLIQATLNSLDRNKLFRNPNVTATPVDKHNVDLTIFGDKPLSGLSFGGDFDGSHGYIHVSGKHFITSPVPGFVDYNLSYSPKSTDQAYSLSIPITYFANREIKVAANHSTKKIVNSKYEVARFSLNIGSPIYSRHFLDTTNFAIGRQSYKVQNTQSDFFTAQTNTNYTTAKGTYLKFINNIEINEASHDWKINTKLKLSGAMEIRPQLELRTQLSADFNTSSNDLPKHRKIYNDDFSYVRGYNTGEIGGTLHVGNSFGLKSLYTSKVEIAKQQLISEKNFSIGMHISGALAKNGNAERYFNSTGAFLAWDFGFGNIDLSLNATNNHTTPVIQFSIVNRY
jgi:hypothetical protein